MRKLLLALGLLLVIPVIAYAQINVGDTGLDATGGAVYGGPAPEIGTFIGDRIITPLFGLLGAIFLLLIIYGGLLWMTAGGEAAQTKKATEIMSNAVIGLIILVSAYAITRFVFGVITAPQTGFLGASYAYAQDYTGQLNNAGAAVYGSEDAPQGNLYFLVGTFINALLSILGVILLILTIYAGILWMTAGGNEHQIEKAQQLIRNAIIGLIITLAAYSITTYVTGALTSIGSSNPTRATDGGPRN